MKQIFFILLLVFSLTACQDVETAEKPENLIEKEKMVDVLFDLTKLEATKNYSTREFKKREVEAKELIFEKYKIDSLQLAQSMAYYAEDFKVNEAIYDEVKARLEKEKDHFDSIIEAQRTEKTDSIQIKKEQDSIKNALQLKLKESAINISDES
jgi:hypothetical protein